MKNGGKEGKPNEVSCGLGLSKLGAQKGAWNCPMCLIFGERWREGGREDDFSGHRMMLCASPFSKELSNCCAVKLTWTLFGEQASTMWSAEKHNWHPLCDLHMGEADTEGKEYPGYGNERIHPASKQWKAGVGPGREASVWRCQPRCGDAAGPHSWVLSV